MSAAWREDAACADSGEPELFDPVGENEPIEFAHRRAQVAVARYCARCPVLDECGREAELHEYQGVWSGYRRDRRHAYDLLGERRPLRHGC